MTFKLLAAVLFATITFGMIFNCVTLMLLIKNLMLQQHRKQVNQLRIQTPILTLKYLGVEMGVMEEMVHLEQLVLRDLGD